MKIIHDAKLKQINFLDERFYTEDGITFYPSVTTVLDVWPKGYGYIQWLKDLGMNAEEVLRRASEQGSKVHAAIEALLKGEELSWSEDGSAYTLEEWLMILKFMDFWRSVNPELIETEMQIISHKLKIGGTIDIVCRINGQVWLIDTKTSNNIYTTHELQLAAYATMWNELHKDMPIERTGILWLKAGTRGPDKAGKKIQGKGWCVKEFDRPYQEAMRLYESARTIWDEENPNYKPKDAIYPSVIKI